MLDGIKKTRTHLYDYDFILFDFPPALTEVGYSVLSACDHILVPSCLDINSLEVSDILNTVDLLRVKGINTDIDLLGLFFAPLKTNSAFNKQLIKLSKEALGDAFMETPIRDSEDIKWSMFFGIPISWAKRGSQGTKDYEYLTMEILKRLCMLPSEEEALNNVKREFCEKYRLE